MSKTMIYLLTASLLLLIILFMIGCKTLSVPQYKGPVSDHFDGKKFHNPGGNQMGSFRKLMAYQFSNKAKKWPDLLDEVDTESSKLEARVYTGIKYKQVNHATVLIQHSGLNILTDPVFSMRASPFQWMGPKRKRNPSIRIEDLPDIDVIVISHDHYDHLDVKSLKKLSEKHNCKILVGLGLKAFLDKFDIPNVIEMDWNDIHSHKGIEFIFHSAVHWSNRMASPYSSLWGSWIIKTNSKIIYFAGDTAYGDHFKEIKDKYKQIDLALIPIGAYVPRFFMQQVHMAPEDAFKAHVELDPVESLAIHWGTFKLTGESMFDPVDELQVHLDSADVQNFYYDRNHDQYYSL